MSTEMKIKPKRISKNIRIRITPEMLIEAFVELVYFSKSVARVKITMSRYGNKVPTHDVNISCSGRGRVKGKIVKGVFHGTIYGSEQIIQKWNEFFQRFIQVPAFSLNSYINWLKNGNNI